MYWWALGALAIGQMLSPLAARLAAHEPITTKLTWSREISRLLQQRCWSCHQENGPAPMALLTYENARPWAVAIKEKVLAREMPPVGAVKGFGAFRNDEALTQEEVLRIAEWVEGGAPEGEAKLAPVPRAQQPAALPGLPVLRLVPGEKLQKAIGLAGLRPLESVASAQIVAEFPDGRCEPLLWLREYRAEWKRTFLLREPLSLPRGSRIIVQPAVRMEFLSPAHAR